MFTEQIQLIEEDFKSILDRSLTIGPNSIRSDQIEIYKTIRSSGFPYACKHSMLTTGVYGFPCNSVCNPILNTDVIYDIDDTHKENLSEMKVYHCMQNPTCFKRCGSSSTGCDPSGSIDVRLLEKIVEFGQYYDFRPEKLMARDLDMHPESLKIHKAMLKEFPENSKAARKIINLKISDS
jgi:hypothetical protein